MIVKQNTPDSSDLKDTTGATFQTDNPMEIRVRNDSLYFEGPQGDLCVEFHRTLRIPDDGNT